MTPFTDDDLKRLKERSNEIGWGRRVLFIRVDVDQLDALLARLEAAELCAAQFAKAFLDNPLSINWLKKAGKSK